MVDVAIQYLRAGWSVIPLRPGSKKPAVEWQPYIQEKATEQQVEEWWRSDPRRNIGLVCGPISGVCVVDVDQADPAPIYREAPCDLIQRTPKGWHLVYKHPGHHVLTRAGVLPGVDVRGDGGYIVAAPSVVEGKEYKWVRNEAEGLDCLTPPPPFVHGSPDPRERSHGPDPTVVGTSPASPERWVAEMFEGAKVGMRNQNAARLAGYLASKEIPPDIAKNILRNWNKTRNDDPESMPDREIDRTIQSVYERHKRSPRMDDRVPTKFDTMSLSDYMVRYANETVEWIIEDWLPLDTIAFIVSPPGSFKTWLLLDAMLSIATKKPFLGKWEVGRSGPVVLIQQEDNHSSLVNRINTVLWSKLNLGERHDRQFEFSAKLMPKDLPVHIYPGRMLRFDNEEIVEAFRMTMRRLRPMAVFIDPLYTAVSLDNYMSKAAEQMMVLKQLRDEIGCSFIIAHHTTKGDAESRKKPSDDTPADRLDLWGSQFLNAYLETGWQIRRTAAPNIIRIRRHFKDTSDPSEIALEMDISDEKMKSNPSRQFVSKQASKDYSEILGFMSQNGPQSINGMANKMGKSRNTIRSYLKELASSGEVRKLADDTWVVVAIKQDESEATVQDSQYTLIDD